MEVRNSDGFPPEANASLLASKFQAPQTLLLQYLAVLAAKYSKNIQNMLSHTHTIKLDQNAAAGATNNHFLKYVAKFAKKGGPLQKLARGYRQTHFGTFDFWVTSPKGAPTHIFSDFCKYLAAQISQKESQDCLKLTREQTGIGLRRESVDFPDLQKVETLIFVILGRD